jgi:hypothetical protein
MAYVLPQVLVFQEFTQLPTAITEPLRAHISGGNAELFRYDESDEKTQILLGAYDKDNDTDYLWPNRPTGGIVDQTYVKLWGDDVLLQYFEDLIGVDDTMVPVAGYNNRVQSAATNFKANTFGATTYARDAALLDRDVAVGDTVDVSAVVSGSLETLRTTVKSIKGDIVADIIAAATGDTNNEVDQTADATIAKTAGADTCVSATVDGTSYDGSVEGDIQETYTITVTTSSTGGDLTTALLRVRSASGNDDADGVSPSASGVVTDIGARGLDVTWTFASASSCSADALFDGVSDEDLIAGQEWTVTVVQDFTAPVATSGGDYTGDTDTTYIVEVTRGGEFTNTLKPQVTVTTVHGVDVSGPTNVTAAATAVAVGSKGVTTSFDGGADRLRKGDIYYVGVTAEGEGPMRVLELNNNMSDDLAAEADLNVTLYIAKSDIEIPRKRTGAAPLVNYVLGDAGVNDTGFTVNSGVTAFDATWTDSGVEQPLDVVEATLYMEYRAWVCSKGNKVYGISDIADIDDIPGALDPDNELKWGVSKALANANGTEVKYTAVCDPSDIDEWQNVIEQIVGRDDVYGLVPLTKNKTYLDLFQAHVNSQSVAEAGRWRVLWVNLTVTNSTAVVDATESTDGEAVLATIGDDPDVSGDQWTIVSVPAGNANFITNGAAAGDIMRYNYTTDGWDDESYDEFVIDAVINEDSIRLNTGQSTIEVTVAKKMEVHHNLNATEQAEQLATDAGVWGSRRVRAVWPDTVGSGGVTFSGYHACAILAGLRSGVAPNQGLTNVEMAGLDDVDRTVDMFNKTQLDDMANSGVWIITQADDGSIITRHELTTAGYGDVLTQEEMVTSNVDSMSFGFLNQTQDLIGRANVTPGTIEIIQNRVEGIIEFYKEVRIARLGGQLTEGQVLEIRQHSILKDRIVVNLELLVPVPLNNLELHLQIVA